MDHVYEFGITYIDFIQRWFEGYDSYFELVNKVFNPTYVSEYMVPALSVLDSVFASQLLVCMATCCWINSVLKWVLLEDRPYWWVCQHSAHERRLYQTAQTCETGAGSPSGHSAAVALVCTHVAMCCAHVAHDYKWEVPVWVTRLTFPMVTIAIMSVVVARMYVAAHFPHQCLLGLIVGFLVPPVMCVYVTDPFVWSAARHTPSRGLHVLGALAATGISYATYLNLKNRNVDPFKTVKLAFRWCNNPGNIHVSASPMYAIVMCTAYMMACALAVTPAVAGYRHYTKNRSLVISAVATFLVHSTFQLINDNMLQSGDTHYYVYQYLICILKTVLYLRVVPMISMSPCLLSRYSSDPSKH